MGMEWQMPLAWSGQMPLARYFLFVGVVLLALLFAADAYLPKLPVAARANADLPVIRIHIHSDRKWPERVVYDTSLPTIIPTRIANTDADVTVPVTVADVSTTTQAREAFAQLRPSDSKKLEPKPQHKRKLARSRAAPPMVLMAQRFQFGWYGHRVW
jgi:hypothetical protein